MKLDSVLEARVQVPLHNLFTFSKILQHYNNLDRDLDLLARRRGFSSISLSLKSTFLYWYTTYPSVNRAAN